MKRKAEASAAAAVEVEAVADTGRGGEASSSPSRVIYIGQLPHGFYEEQLKGKAATPYAYNVVM